MARQEQFDDLDGDFTRVGLTDGSGHVLFDSENKDDKSITTLSYSPDIARKMGMHIPDITTQPTVKRLPIYVTRDEESVRIASDGFSRRLTDKEADELGMRLLELSGHEVEVQDDDGLLSFAEVVALAAADGAARFERVDAGGFIAGGFPSGLWWLWRDGAPESPVYATVENVIARWREVANG